MKHKLELLQVSRGFAALLVILFHFQDTSITYFKTIAFNNFFSNGNIGVDFFFELSGFIITYVHYSDLQNRSSPFNFLKKRFVRIYPTYWVIATITLAVLILVLKGRSPHLDHYMDIKSPHEWLYIVKCYLLLPMQNQYFLQLAWTLSYEVLFYVLFFVGIIIGLRKAKYLLLIWLLLILGNGTFYTFHGILISKILSGVNIEFMMGCFVAYIFKNSYRIPKWISLVVLISIPLYVFLRVYVFKYEIEKNLFSLILLTIFIGVLLYNIVAIDIHKKVKCSRLLLLIGEASYSIYLSHTFFLGTFGRAFSKIIFSFNMANGFILQIIFFGIFLLIVLSGVLFFKFVEKPLTAFCNKHLFKKKLNVT